MSQIQSKMKVKGGVVLVLFGPDGQEKDRREIRNLVVNNGLNFIANALVASSTSPMNAIALGTGSTAAAASNSTLETELVRAATTTNSASGAVATFARTFAAGSGTGSLTEAGILNNSSSGGTLLCRTVFGTITKGASDTLAVTWTITLSDV